MQNPLKGIESYNDEMTISQVVKFFERAGIVFTKTMIQNYVRIGLMPPPKDKRFYGQNHLMMLTMVHNMKAVFSLDEIEALFAVALSGQSKDKNDVYAMSAIYGDFIEMNKLVDIKLENLKNDVKNDPFSTALLFMSVSIAAKKVAQALINQEADS